MNQKLYEIFSEKHQSIISKFRAYRPQRYVNEAEEEWRTYLKDSEIDRVGKLLKMIIPCPDEQIEFKDPSGDDSFIRINKDLALKIVTLGYIPNNGEFA